MDIVNFQTVKQTLGSPARKKNNDAEVLKVFILSHRCTRIFGSPIHGYVPEFLNSMATMI